MLRSLLFESTETETPDGRNWRIFSENSKTLVKTNLTLTNPVNDTIVDKGIFVLYGPMVFFDIMLSLVSGDGWDGTSYIKMPFFNLNVAGTLQFEGLFNVFDPADGTLITQAYMATEENLMFAGSHTASGDQQVRIQGWYFRN